MRSGNGRHRRPRQAPALFVTAGVTGAGIALPLLGASGAHAADTATWDRVAQCESGGVWSSASGNGFYGGLQLTQDLWKQYGGLTYAPRPDMASRAQQIAVAEAILDDRGPDAWPSCAVNAGLTRDGRDPGVDPGGTSTPTPEPSWDGGQAEGQGPEDGQDPSRGQDPSGADDSWDGAPGPSGTADPGAEDGTSPDTSDDGRADDAPDGSTDASPAPDGTGAPGDDTSGDPSGGDPSDDGPSDDGPSESDPAHTGPAHTGPADTDPSDTAPSDSGQDGRTGTPPSGPGGREPAPDGTAGTGKHRGGGAPDEADAGSDRGGEGHAPGRHASRGDGQRTAPTAGGDYTVRPGDNLSAIAQAHDLPGGWPALYAHNEDVIGADADLIHPGQLLDLGN